MKKKFSIILILIVLLLVIIIFPSIYLKNTDDIEDKIGSIEVGKYADFVVLDKNPLEVSKENLKEIKVLETIKQGNTIFKA